jgi:hypothetical protein
MMSRRFHRQNSPDIRAMDTEAAGDLGIGEPVGFETAHLCHLDAHRRLAALVFTAGLGRRDPFTLAFEHNLALELGDRAQNIKHQAPSRGRGVDAHGQDLEAGALGRDPPFEPQGLVKRPGEAVELGDDEQVGIAFP